jgi:hypothetical protein
MRQAPGGICGGKIVQAGYESARTGRPIHLRERFGEL